jgi:DNA-binding CsgD family transcriptional regulator
VVWVSELRRRLDVLTLTLLSRLAEAIVAELDRVLHDALTELGPMLDFDQAMIFATADARSDLCVRLTWTAPDVSPAPLSRLQDAFPKLITRILRGELVEVRRVGDLRSHAPRDFASLRALGLRSVLVLPLGLGGAVEGALVLGGTSRARNWPVELAGELRTLGHAMAMGLHRHRDAGPLAVEPAGLVDRRREAARLTERQLEVLQLLGRGQTMKQIAEHLDISPRTVAFHKARIKEALGASTTAELLRKAVKARVLDP